ncbi:MAG: 6-phosphogluconolactonase [Candidatus Thiodiazotropha sp. (ex Dulcina madagascariensis)]|nr:6-phosphogluconolactonase [Candidatus Thiodiazotropha sp. (ex Epidulcina cf. delphinae)]MCU7921122.1 6-phosphogluconolactonase [Candidatus Thiodiazotropha sp. (ex Dulcina madagascariensis)]MCU7926752.1 6-phosphogluconolactonase [Candidatus Thiodiazotropha sp. (ex Dulcina madagascariensis)]MCU7935741.1 6-phosphogluconolactonase [Candidatus Thiodiazotropha sp. (ex Dulcina madagascariensis)]
MTGGRFIVDEKAFAEQAEQWIFNAIQAVLETSPRCHLMLAGGSTPLPVYRRLAKRGDIPWSRISLYFGDERCVPVDTPESNYHAVMTNLFHGPVPEGLVVHRMCGEEEPDRAAQGYESLLPERVDILLLGMGDDGHTASLFPGSAALDEERRRVMPVIGSKPPLQRLTVTPPVIRGARHLLMMVQGGEKADAVRRALLNGSVPAALAKDGDWLMEGQAARSLPG